MFLVEGIGREEGAPEAGKILRVRLFEMRGSERARLESQHHRVSALQERHGDEQKTTE